MGSIESKNDNDDTQDGCLSSYGQLQTVACSDQNRVLPNTAWTFADGSDETAAYRRTDEDPMNCGGQSPGRLSCAEPVGCLRYLRRLTFLVRQ
jgi:hypothetical protein